MFWDNVLGWLARRAKIPDLEIIVNLGDWPLIKTGSGSLARLPMISWCGSEDTEDMLVPTYELTEASIECMGRQSLDVLASLGRNEVAWEDKVETLFWRGRDSNRNRLKLAKISKNSPLVVTIEHFKHENINFCNFTPFLANWSCTSWSTSNTASR